MKTYIFSKNFVYLILGQGLSMFGTNILKFSISLYILNMTGSAALFGMVTALSYIPPIILSPFGGVLADRLDKRKLMASLDLGYGVISFILGVLVLQFNNLTIISLLLVFLSIISSFETPVVQSSIPLIQPEEKLIKSNAVINQVTMISGLTGPFLAGVLYGFFGTADIYYIMFLCAVCFSIAVCFELLLTIPEQASIVSDHIYETVRHDLKAALKFTIKEKGCVGGAILLNAIFLFLIQPLLTVGAPYMICVSLGFSSGWNGASQMFMGIAGVIGGMLAGLVADTFNVKNVYIFFMGMGAALIPVTCALLAEWSSIYIFVFLNISCFIIFVLASIVGIFLISAIQKITPPHMLGRVMSFYTTVMNCSLPFGMWIFGFLYEIFENQLYIILGVTAAAIVLTGLSGKKIYIQLQNDM